MDPQIAKTTQDILGPHIKNPPLSEKLLQKPPLRFLHDIFVSIANQYGILSGLFDDDEVAWNDVVANDKDAKAFFIAKIVNYTSIAKAQELDVKPARVCSGQDPESTNGLLQALGELIANKAIDNEDVLHRVLKKQGPIDLGTFPKGSAFLSSSAPAQQVPRDRESKIPPPSKNSAVPGSTVKVAASVKASTPPTKLAAPKQREPVDTARKVAKSQEPQPPTARLKGAADPKKTGKDEVISRPAMPVASGSKLTKDEPVVLKVRPSEAPVAAQRASVVGKTLAKASDTSKPKRTEISKPTARASRAPQDPVVLARPTTARRAPQRPTTARISAQEQSAMLLETATTPTIEEAPPANLRFLKDEPDREGQNMTESLLNLELIQQPETRGLDIFLPRQQVRSGESGQLVAHLQNIQKEFVEENGATEEANPVAQQEVARFSKDVEELCTSLQRVSRLTDLLTTYMEMLPEDLEDMDRDRQRYHQEYLLIQQQISETNKTEEVQMEKLRREQALQEEALFVIQEEIVSAHLRIQEKTDLLTKLKRLTTL